MLTEYLNELNSNDLDPGKMAFLRRPVESRLQHFKLMKAQKEMLAKEGGQKDKINAIGQKQLADDNKQKSCGSDEAIQSEFQRRQISGS